MNCVAETEPPADHAGIALETALPQSVTQNHRTALAGWIADVQDAPDIRRDSEYREKLAGHERSSNDLGSPRSRSVCSVPMVTAARSTAGSARTAVSVPPEMP